MIILPTTRGTISRRPLVPSGPVGIIATNPIAWYDVTSFSGTTWTDKSGNGNNATASNVTTISTTGGGSSQSNMALSGTSSSNVIFPNILTANYTLFHVSRYTNNNQRIFTSNSTVNWLSGFWKGNAGVAYHNGWLTAQANNANGGNWVVSADQWTLYRANKTSFTTLTPGSVTVPTVWGINAGWELGAFQCMEVIVYNVLLSTTDIQAIENYLYAKYSLS